MAGRTTGNKAREIGSRIQKRREELNISQLELSVRVGTSTRAIFGYEKGEHLPRRETLQRLADALETTVSMLCGEETKDEELHHLTSKERELLLRLRQLDGDNRLNAEKAIDSILMALLSAQNGRRKK